MDRIRSKGATLVAISGDTAEQAAELVETLGLDFVLVSDVDLTLTEAFGVRQEGKDAPLPSVFVLDRDGRVLWSAVGTSIVTRPSLDEMLSHLP